jgi:paraquat-inducible protein B
MTINDIQNRPSYGEMETIAAEAIKGLDEATKENEILYEENGNLKSENKVLYSLLGESRAECEEKDEIIEKMMTTNQDVYVQLSGELTKINNRIKNISTKNAEKQNEFEKNLEANIRKMFKMERK